MSTKNSQAASDVFEELKNLVGDDLEQINKNILSLTSDASLIPRITQYLACSGGKRIRPMLCIASAKLLHTSTDPFPQEQIIALASAIEFVHTATLLHDDVIDGSEKRRGKDVANIVWGNKPVILVGDYLFSQAFRLMVKSESLQCLDLLASTSASIAESEVLQLDMIDNIDINQEQYIDLITSKTAVLFAASCASAAIVSGASKKQCDQLYNFGLNLGISFQIIDDVLDYLSDQDSFGKTIGRDYYDGKITLPLIYAYNKSTQKDKDIIMSNFKNTKNNDTLSQIIDIIKKYNAFQGAIDLANQFSSHGAKNLDHFNDSSTKQLMNRLIFSFIKRAA